MKEIDRFWCSSKVRCSAKWGDLLNPCIYGTYKICDTPVAQILFFCANLRKRGRKCPVTIMMRIVTAFHGSTERSQNGSVKDEVRMMNGIKTV